LSRYFLKRLSHLFFLKNFFKLFYSNIYYSYFSAFFNLLEVSHVLFEKKKKIIALDFLSWKYVFVTGFNNVVPKEQPYSHCWLKSSYLMVDHYFGGLVLTHYGKVKVK